MSFQYKPRISWASSVSECVRGGSHWSAQTSLTPEHSRRDFYSLVSVDTQSSANAAHLRDRGYPLRPSKWWSRGVGWRSRRIRDVVLERNTWGGSLTIPYFPQNPCESSVRILHLRGVSGISVSIVGILEQLEPRGVLSRDVIWLTPSRVGLPTWS